jgi:hypothetical protein
MNKILFIILLLVCLFNVSLFAQERKPAAFLENEKIDYVVKLRGVSIGRASLVYKGKVKLDNKDAHKIIFSTNTVNFKDVETMYAQIDTFLPLRIERDINNWGKKMRIVEEYDQDNNSVRISQINKQQNKTQVIKQDEKIENVILSIFLHRKLADLEIGKDFSITLPLRKIIMRVTKKTPISVPHGKYMAYLVESFPKGHRIWLEESQKAIPVRI